MDQASTHFDTSSLPVEMAPDLLSELEAFLLKGTSHFNLALDQIPEFEKNVPLDSLKALHSAKGPYFQPSVYIGTGGTSYLNWRLYLFTKDKAYRDKALAVFNKLYQEVSRREPASPVEKAPAFFLGIPGIITLGAILTGDEEERKSLLGELAKRSEACFMEQSQDELVYGNAGYVYCILLLRKHLGEVGEELNAILEKVVQDLLKQGKEQGGGLTLRYSFPRGQH